MGADLTLRPFRLINKIQSYAWGARGEEAIIPRMLGIEPEAGQPYAELWIGTHPKAPSEVALDGATVMLEALIARAPDRILGPDVARRFSGRMPFLFKVLSAAEPLSIQSHPDREQARRLHARDPEHYPDPNHKPEVAVALDQLTALVGFKSLPELVQALERYPELAEFAGQAVVDRLKDSPAPGQEERRALVRALYAPIIRRSVADPQGLNAAIARLATRLRGSPAGRTEAEEIFLECREVYTGADVGLFSIFLLNLVHLERGQGIFTPAGIPHAYVRGNIVECMSNSDNVVRAGLTPKFQDVEALIDVLTYESGPTPILGTSQDVEAMVYRTPAAEFEVSRWLLAPGDRRRQRRFGVLLVTQGRITLDWSAGDGSGEAVLVQERGQAVLVPAGLEEVTIDAVEPAEVFKVEIPTPLPRRGKGPA